MPYQSSHYVGSIPFRKNEWQGCCGVYDLTGYWSANWFNCFLFVLTSNAGLTGTGANDLQDANVTVLGGLLAEIIFTCVFVLIVLGSNIKRNGETNKFAGLAIGLGLVPYPLGLYSLYRNFSESCA